MEAVTQVQLESYDPRPARRGDETRYLCPLSAVCRDKPGDNAHRSLSVENATGVFYCHRCGEKGKLREFWDERSPARPAIKRTQLRPAAALISRAIREVKSEKKADLDALRERMSGLARKFSNSAAQKYLQARGIPRKVSSNAGCGYAPEWEHWEKEEGEWKLIGTDRRAVFPVYDAAKELVAIHTRAIDELHFHSSKITKGNKSRGVFYSSPDVFSSPVIAICEGPVDALALETCGIPAVAMIGTSAPKWLATALKDKSILLATDADQAGDEAAGKLRELLRSRAKNILRLRPPTAKDWAEELENAGVKKMRQDLLPFAPETDDVTRANSSWYYAQEDDYDAAEFIARLIEDKELKESFLVLIHKEYLKAA